MPHTPTQQVVGTQSPNTTPPVVQAPGRQKTGNLLPNLGTFGGFLQKIRELRGPKGTVTPKVAPTNTQTVGSGAPTQQVVGAPQSTILNGLRALSAPRVFRPAPRSGPTTTGTSRNTSTSRIAPRNTSTTRATDQFGKALARRNRGVITSNNPRELRLKVASIRNRF